MEWAAFDKVYESGDTKTFKASLYLPIRMKYLLFLSFFLSMGSCYTVERKYYYDEALIKKIKEIKRSRIYTYIDFQLPKPEYDEVKAYLRRKIEYRFKAPRSA